MAKFRDYKPIAVVPAAESPIPTPAVNEILFESLTAEDIQKAISAAGDGWNEFKERVNKTAGRLQPWECNLSPEQRTAVLQSLLGASFLNFVNVHSLITQLLLTALNDKNGEVIGNNLGPFLWIAEDYCNMNQPSPQEINCRSKV